MGDIEISRVQEDLETMRRAIEPIPSFSMEHVWHNLCIACVGAIVGGVAQWSGVAAPVDGGANPWYVALILVAAVTCVVIALPIAMRTETTPSFMRVSLQSTVAAVLSTALYIGFVILVFRMGISLESVAITTVFLCGALQLASSVFEEWNPLKFGWGLTFVCMSFLLPFGSYESAGFIAGAFLTVGGILVATLTYIQIRSSHVVD